MAPSAQGGATLKGGDPTGQEFQLETRHFVLLVLIVVVLCAASFELGRWVERQSLGPAIPLASVAGTAGGGSDANVEDVGDVSKDLTFFDTLAGGAPTPLQAPVRQSPRSSPGAAPPGSTRRSVNEGVMIQVFASKDRAAADAVRKRLRAKGYTALLASSGGAYKVRVGPYADRTEAERQAAILREQERLTTWIP